MAAEAGAQSQKQEEKTTRKEKTAKTGLEEAMSALWVSLIRAGKQSPASVVFWQLDQKDIKCNKGTPHSAWLPGEREGNIE